MVQPQSQMQSESKSEHFISKMLHLDLTFKVVVYNIDVTAICSLTKCRVMPH